MVPALFQPYYAISGKNIIVIQEGGLEATRIYEDWLFSYFTILKISSGSFVKLQRPTS